MPLDTPDLTEFSTASPVIATFGFTDIASGLGYSNFFLNLFREFDGQETHILFDNEISENAMNTITTSAKDITTNVFNLSRTIKGDVYFNFTVISPASGKRHTLSLFHVDVDNNETQLGDTWTTQDNKTPATAIFTVTRQVMEVGSKLRLKIQAVGVNSSISDLILAVPFEVNI